MTEYEFSYKNIGFYINKHGIDMTKDGKEMHIDPRPETDDKINGKEIIKWIGGDEEKASDAVLKAVRALGFITGQKAKMQVGFCGFEFLPHPDRFGHLLVWAKGEKLEMTKFDIDEVIEFLVEHCGPMSSILVGVKLTEIVIKAGSVSLSALDKVKTKPRVDFGPELN